MARTLGHFIEARDSLVTDAIDGLLASGGGTLARLDGYPDIRVVLRAERDAGKVAVISGGGSGHEPAHAGLVGAGLLDAAVCGDVFASPSADAVLAGILAVSGPAGCLVVVKNYAGDRLNFGLAAERARGMGIAVETVLVADDIALPGATQPRGVAGTLFVHKVAGHAAAAGLPLEEVAARARRAASAARSLGIAVSTATIPGSRRAERMEEGQAELGLGIHGEPGVERVALPPASDLARIMTERLAATLPGDGPLALLVNNLGATTSLEMQVLTRAVLATNLGKRVRLLLGPAPAMTALDMHGASLSFLALDGELEEALLSPVPVLHWPMAVRIAAPQVKPLPGGLEGERFTPSRDDKAAARIAAVAKALVAAEAELNALDAKVGDGDTGTTFAGAARAVLADLDKLPQADPPALARALAERIGRAAGGSSGVLGSIFFAAAGASLASGAVWPEALHEGVARVRAYGGAGPGDRTMLDALIPALDALKTGDLASAAHAAREGARATAGMTRAATGRSSYLASGDLQGTEDPGAAAIAIAFAALT
ncbi:dihydroxyacetone kinase subunit DhaK [Methylobacterium komagatae]|uniref:Dihydroxyacetone kinase subunit DhaK n=1 Tax=Methylobacterium komagatae TaxID=374425 RepID=A0ABW2BTG5_9HYPH